MIGFISANTSESGPCSPGLTVAELRVEVLIDGVQRVLLLAAMFSGSEDVPHTLVKEGILALQHTRKWVQMVDHIQRALPVVLPCRGQMGGGVPQSGPCADGAGGGQTHSRTGRWFLLSPTAAEPDPRR